MQGWRTCCPQLLPSLHVHDACWAIHRCVDRPLNGTASPGVTTPLRACYECSIHRARSRVPGIHADPVSPLAVCRSMKRTLAFSSKTCIEAALWCPHTPFLPVRRSYDGIPRSHSHLTTAWRWKTRKRHGMSRSVSVTLGKHRGRCGVMKLQTLFIGEQKRFSN